MPINKEKLYIKALQALKSEHSLNEYELANKIFKIENANPTQIQTSYEILEDLLNKGLISKKTLVKDRYVSEGGNIFDAVDNRFKISIDGLSYLKSTPPIFSKTVKEIVVGVTIAVIAGILVWWLTAKQ